MTDDWIIDAVLAPLSITVMIGYHFRLLLKYKKNPLKTLQGVNHRLRYLWIKQVMNGKNKDILAVQSIRNSLMICSLLASTAIILSTGLSAYTLSEEKMTPLIDFIVGGKSKTLLMIKLLCLVVLFQTCFFCFMQSMRYLNHVNYLVNACDESSKDSDLDAVFRIGPDIISRVMEKAMNYYTLGIRFYYIAFPFLVWIFGPIPMFLFTVLLVTILQSLDASYDVINKEEELALKPLGN